MNKKTLEQCADKIGLQVPSFFALQNQLSACGLQAEKHVRQHAL